MGTLASLAADEQRLYAQVISLTGTLETKTQYLENTGVFAAYKELHRHYLAACQTATSESDKLELLKRLLFLNWYGMLEPSFLTGISELDEEVVFAAYSLLNNYIRDKRLDEELHWMISYYSSWDYLLLHYAENQLPELTDFITATNHEQYHPPEHQLPPGTMDNRRQMGIYWQSLGVERTQ